MLAVFKHIGLTSENGDLLNLCFYVWSAAFGRRLFLVKKLCVSRLCFQLVFFHYNKKKGARIHVLMGPCCRAALQEESSLFIMQIRWLWREQWPFKVSKSQQTNSWPNARYILPEMTPRPPGVCLAAAGAIFAAAGAFCFQSVKQMPGFTFWWFHVVERPFRINPRFLSCRSVVCGASSGLSKSAIEFLAECAIYFASVQL